ERKREVADVAMDDVEVARMLEDAGQLQQMESQIVPGVAIEAQGAGRGGHELGLGPRVAAREERHVVPALDQLLREIADNPLRPSVESGRHPLVEGGDLRDAEAPAHDEVDSEESGPSSALVRMTGVSAGQSS